MQECLGKFHIISVLYTWTYTLILIFYSKHTKKIKKYFRVFEKHFQILTKEVQFICTSNVQPYTETICLTNTTLEMKIEAFNIEETTTYSNTHWKKFQEGPGIGFTMLQNRTKVIPTEFYPLTDSDRTMKEHHR